MPKQTFGEKIYEIKKNLGSWMPNPALQVELEEGLDELKVLYESMYSELLNEKKLVDDFMKTTSRLLEAIAKEN